MNLLLKAQQYIPGGVNSPVRAFQGVGGDPIFIEKGIGSRLVDVKGKQYIDYVGSWGPLILGHAHPYVIARVKAAVEEGLTFGAPTAAEVALAEKICSLVPSVEMIRMVNSGTEATMSAIRLARGVTHRDKIIKFAGCYHGHSDALLVKSGSGPLTLGVPDSAGVPSDVVKHTLIAEFNDLNQVEQWFTQHGSEIAAVIVEPVAGNMNCILPKPGFLSGLRSLCDRYESLLIFDEVITGFRVALGGAQTLYGVRPDLTTFGKIIGGGMPVGAFGGRKDVMEQVAPLGPVYQAGTLSGNPIAMTAGLATLELLESQHFYEQLEQKTARLLSGLKAQAQRAQLPLLTQHVGSMFGLFFTDQTEVNTYTDVKKVQVEVFKTFFHRMLEAGFYFAPSAFEVGFISTAHTDREIDLTIQAAGEVFSDC